MGVRPIRSPPELSAPPFCGLSPRFTQFPHEFSGSQQQVGPERPSLGRPATECASSAVRGPPRQRLRCVQLPTALLLCLGTRLESPVAPSFVPPSPSSKRNNWTKVLPRLWYHTGKRVHNHHLCSAALRCDEKILAPWASFSGRNSCLTAHYTFAELTQTRQAKATDFGLRELQETAIGVRLASKLLRTQPTVPI